MSVDTMMLEWFENPCQWDRHFRWRNQLPECRQDLIDQGIKAYQAGFYAAATTLFLSKVVGILYEATERSYKIEDWFKTHLLLEAEWLTPWIHAVRAQRDQDYRSGKPESSPGWNRHQIMHGLTGDFNTPLHALKAAVWVELMGSVVNISTWLDDMKEEKDGLLAWLVKVIQ